MMADLISRAAAIAEVEEYLQELDSCISEPDLKLDGYRNGLQVAINELKDLPAVDAVPVIHARWKSYSVPHWTKRLDDYGDPEYKYHDEHVCSACGRRTIIKENFCPKCGAKMDGERRDSE